MTDNGIDTLFAYNPIGFHGGTGLAEEGGGVSLPAGCGRIEMYGVGGPPPLLHGRGRAADRAGRPERPRSTTTATRTSTRRVDYKFGGMGLDGDTTGREAPARELAREVVPRRRVRLHGATEATSTSTIDGPRRQRVQDAAAALQPRRRLRARSCSAT